MANQDLSFICLVVQDLALTMVTKSCLREAPPTRNPSMSGFAARSLQLAAVTEPETK